MKRWKKEFHVSMALLLIMAMLSGNSEEIAGNAMPQIAVAQGKMRLSRSSVTMKNDDIKSIRVKNPKKRVRWKISTKKYAHIDTYGKKNSICEISTDGRGKAGSFTVTATVGKRKFKCHVSVKGMTENKNDGWDDGDVTTTSEPVSPSPTPSASLPTEVPAAEKYGIKFDELKQCVMNQGVVNVNGHKIIRKSSKIKTANYIWVVVYDESNDSLEFIQINEMTSDYGTEATGSVSMILTKTDSSYTSAEVIYSIGSGVLSGTASIYKSTFTNNTPLYVTLDTNTFVSSSSSDAKDLCESTIKTAFLGWNDLLGNYGFSLADMGFTSY